MPGTRELDGAMHEGCVTERKTAKREWSATLPLVHWQLRAKKQIHPWKVPQPMPQAEGKKQTSTTSSTVCVKGFYTGLSTVL